MPEENELTPEEQQLWDSIDINDTNPAESEEETTEQPDTDSDQQTEDEPQETNEEEPVKSESQEEKEPLQRYKVKARNQEFDFELPEVLQLASKGIDYTKKMQQIAPYRRVVSAVEQAGLTEKDINLFIDMKQGKKEAIAKFIKDSKIDPLELSEDEGNDYVPQEYGLTNEQQELQEVFSELKSSPVVNKVVQVTDEEWDSASRATLYQQPNLLRQLEKDIRTGIFDVVHKEAQRRKVLEGGNRPDIDYYAETYNGLMKYMREHPEAMKTPSNKEVSQQRQARKAATPPKSSTISTVTDLLSEEELTKLPSDKEYQRWLKSIGE